MIQSLKIKFLFLFLLVPTKLLAIGCDCQVMAFSPITGSLAPSPHVIETYQLESFSKNTERSQMLCRESCQRIFQKEMPIERLDLALRTFSKNLISERAIGYNCTGLTTLKFPVRVKASLGKTGLGNVEDFIQVVSLEETCL